MKNMSENGNNQEFQSSLSRQLWEQFARATGKRVVLTKHLLLAQQLASDSVFVYPASTDISDVALLWNGKMYLGKSDKLSSIAPFLFIRSLAKDDTKHFDDVIDLLNEEFPSSDDVDPEDIVISIKGNGFIGFNPSFDLMANMNNLMTFYKDSSCLVDFFDFFTENIDSYYLLNPEKSEINIAFASSGLNSIINQCVEFFRRKKADK